MKSAIYVGVLALSVAGVTVAQTPSAPTPQPSAKAAAPAAQSTPAKPAQPAPLKLDSLDPEVKADPFPPVNPKLFTVDSPSVATVDSFLHAIWGYDTNRIWRVAAIQKTDAPGVAKVVILVSERTPNAQVQSTVFFITPDEKHAIAGSQVVSFGATPFATDKALLDAKADGPARGAASKALELVEFSDLQCPHCKDAQQTMKQLETDYPKARIVYQPFPLAEIHPFAFEAAVDGVCVERQKPGAYFAFAQAVYDTQGALTPETGAQTLKNAMVKAGADPAAVATCAATQAAKDKVSASVKLGEDIGVDQTPMLAVNGRLLPLGGLPYETLKKIIDFTVAEEGR